MKKSIIIFIISVAIFSCGTKEEKVIEKKERSNAYVDHVNRRLEQKKKAEDTMEKMNAVIRQQEIDIKKMEEENN